MVSKLIIGYVALISTLDSVNRLKIQRIEM